MRLAVPPLCTRATGATGHRSNAPRHDGVGFSETRSGRIFDTRRYLVAAALMAWLTMVCAEEEAQFREAVTSDGGTRGPGRRGQRGRHDLRLERRPAAVLRIRGGGLVVCRGADGKLVAPNFRKTAPQAINADAFQGAGIYTAYTGS